MTGEEILSAFNKFRAEGKTDEEIKITLFMMFRADKFDAYEFYQLTKVLGLPVDDYFLALDIEDQKTYLRWDNENKKTIVMYSIDDDEYIDNEIEDSNDQDVKCNKYTIEQVKQQFEKWKKEDGLSEDEIAVNLYLMFHDDVINAEEFAELMDILGYEVGDEFLNATLEEQKDTSRWVELPESEEFIESSQNEENKDTGKIKKEYKEKINYDVVDDDLEEDLRTFEICEESETHTIEKIKEIEDYSNNIILSINTGFGFDYNSHPELTYSEFMNSTYYGNEDNKYLVLVKARTNEEGEVIIHPDTVCISWDAFDEYSPLNNKIIKKLIIKNDVDCRLEFLKFRVKHLEIQTVSKQFNYSRISYLKDCEYFYFPYLTPYDIKDFNVRYIMAKSYIKSIDRYYLNRKSYEKFIKAESYNLLIHKDLYDETILTYVLENNYLSQSDIKNLLIKCTNQNVIDKIKKYAETNNFDIVDNFSNYALKSLKDMKNNITENNNSNARGLVNYSNNNTLRKSSNNLSIPLRHKYETYINKFYKEGDIFAAKYNDEVLLIQVMDKKQLHECDRDKSYCFFKILTTEDLKNLNIPLSLSLKSDSTSLVIFENVKSLLDIINYKKYLYDGFLKLKPEFGIFKDTYNFNKFIEIPYVVNYQEIMINDKYTDLFEPYFLVYDRDKLGNEVGEPIMFRRIPDLSKLAECINFYKNELLLNILDIKCSYMKPYNIFRNVNKIKVNKNKNEYSLHILLEDLNKKLTVTDRTSTINLIKLEMCHYKQESISNNELKFLPKEWEEILDNYFPKDITTGCYLGWDTHYMNDNDLYMFDEKWFKLLFKAIKKDKIKRLESLDEIKLRGIEGRIFGLFNLSKKELDYFINLINSTDSVEEFLSIFRKPEIIEILCKEV